MKRVNWKFPFINKLFLTTSFMRSSAYKTTIRNSSLAPHFLNKTIIVHAGNVYRRFNVRQDMIWHKMGEYAFTKKMGFRKKKPKGGKKRRKK